MSLSAKYAFLSDNKFDKANFQTTNITSRDQILNPYDFVKLSDYSNNRAGRLQYESDLARAIQIANMQQASYDEWYNSEAQQSARQKIAGLNPDLNGVEASSAGDMENAGIIPGQSVPTNEDFALNVGNTLITGISSVLSGVSSVMGLTSQLKLNKALVDNTKAQTDLVKQQSDAQFMNNIGSFVRNSQSAIADRLAKALSSDTDFDIDSFFKGDFTDILKMFSPSDDIRYSDAFSHVLSNSQQVHSDAYKTLSTTEEGRKQYLSYLASSYYSDDDDEMIGQLSIAVHADEELHRIAAETGKAIKATILDYVNKVDVSAAAGAFNASNTYDEEWFSNLDGSVMAILEKGIKSALFIQQKATSDVYGYLNRQYNSPLNMFMPDRKQRIGWQILAGSTMGWQDHFAATGNQYFDYIINQYKATVENLRANASAVISNAETNRMNADVNSENAVTNRMNAELGARRFSFSKKIDSANSFSNFLNAVLPF